MISSILSPLSGIMSPTGSGGVSADFGGGPATSGSGNNYTSVGGLNVPTYPDFPAFMGGAGTTVESGNANTIKTLAIVGGGLALAYLILK
jgi:hypothetical protein